VQNYMLCVYYLGQLLQYNDNISQDLLFVTI